MGNQCLIVQLLVDIEAIPQVTTDNDSTKAKVFGNTYVVNIHASQCVHMPVDQSVPGSLFQLVCREG